MAIRSATGTNAEFTRHLRAWHDSTAHRRHIPEVGTLADATNIFTYSIEGNAVQAGISSASAIADLIRRLGTAGKIAEYGAKGATKLGAKEAVKATAKARGRAGR